MEPGISSVPAIFFGCLAAGMATIVPGMISPDCLTWTMHVSAIIGGFVCGSLSRGLFKGIVLATIVEATILITLQKAPESRLDEAIVIFTILGIIVGEATYEALYSRLRPTNTHR